jgi:hypothetical protein
VILAGAILLALSLAVAVLIGPWAARWFVAAFWFLAAGVFCYLGLRRVEPATQSSDTPHLSRPRPPPWAVFAVALGFASLAAATAVRAVAGGRAALVWILYAVAAIGMMAPFAGGRPPRRELDGRDTSRLCDNCKEREVELHLTKVENDTKLTLHLCRQCAQQKGS